MFIRGLTGFGSALIMTPLLLFLFDIQSAVVITTIVEIVACSSVTIHARKDISTHFLKIVLPITIVGIVIGSYILVSSDSDLLKRIFGIFTIIFALRILFNLRKRISQRKKWPSGSGYIAGALGGILGGLFGTAGPPITVYLENQIDSKDTLRATLLAYFLILDVIRLFFYGYADIITIEILIKSLVILPAALTGAYIGRFINMVINDNIFRATVSIVLIVTGMLLVMGR